MNKKCTHCGSTSLEPFTAYSEQYLTSNVSCFVCMECKHIEMFANEYSREWKAVVGNVEHRNYVKNEIEIREKKINELQKSIEPLVNEVSKAQEKVSDLETKSNSLDITVRQQQEILEELKKAKEALNIASNNENKVYHQIESLQREINRLKEKGRL